MVAHPQQPGDSSGSLASRTAEDKELEELREACANAKEAMDPAFDALQGRLGNVRVHMQDLTSRYGEAKSTAERVGSPGHTDVPEGDGGAAGAVSAEEREQADKVRQAIRHLANGHPELPGDAHKDCVQHVVDCCDYVIPESLQATHDVQDTVHKLVKAAKDFHGLPSLDPLADFAPIEQHEREYHEAHPPLSEGQVVDEEEHDRRAAEGFAMRQRVQSEYRKKLEGTEHEQARTVSVRGDYEESRAAVDERLSQKRQELEDAIADLKREQAANRQETGRVREEHSVALDTHKAGIAASVATAQKHQEDAAHIIKQIGDLFVRLEHTRSRWLQTTEEIQRQCAETTAEVQRQRDQQRDLAEAAAQLAADRHKSESSAALVRRVQLCADCYKDKLAEGYDQRIVRLQSLVEEQFTRRVRVYNECFDALENCKEYNVDMIKEAEEHRARMLAVAQGLKGAKAKKSTEDLVADLDANAQERRQRLKEAKDRQEKLRAEVGKDLERACGRINKPLDIKGIDMSSMLGSAAPCPAHRDATGDMPRDISDNSFFEGSLGDEA
eukprot:TRINITY_DN51781_c0_g1_i1.p1 TRINITY_DN51781_c0_g1~~TRINITY_DN51781_c0_g1_i1.p1  ORF type:complete len:590 (+),score=217.62 TRINITY_DN51781_c0_g1_i1:105-1772(+)